MSHDLRPVAVAAAWATDVAILPVARLLLGAAVFVFGLAAMRRFDPADLDASALQMTLGLARRSRRCAGVPGTTLSRRVIGIAFLCRRRRDDATWMR